MDFRRILGTGLLAACLLILAVPAWPAEGSDDGANRFVVYCDRSGGCPGVSFGDREDSCEWIVEGVLGTCGYAGRDGVGAGGMWASPVCEGTAYCYGASVDPDVDCLLDKRVTLFSTMPGFQRSVCFRDQGQLTYFVEDAFRKLVQSEDLEAMVSEVVDIVESQGGTG